MKENTLLTDRQTDRQTGRNHGIDALRIVSMMMVVTLHVLGHGGILDSTKMFSFSYEVVWLLEILALCAVNCYALISGYVGVYAKFRYSNLFVLWLRVVFYCIGITVLFKIILQQPLNIKGFIVLLFPAFTNKYWYFTAYFLLFLFIPILNYALNSLSRNQIKTALLTIIFCTSVVAPIFSAFSGDFWTLGNGYTTFWLMILYLLGGYVRKYGLFNNLRRRCLVASYFVISLLVLLSKWLIQITTSRFFGEVKYEDMWASYISITVLAEAICLLLLFERIRIPSIIQKIISFVSPLAFSVYLIHEHPYVREYFITDKFKWIANMNPALMVLTIIGVVLAIFVICIAIDSIREFLFKILKIKQRLNNLELKITERIKRKEKV